MEPSPLAVQRDYLELQLRQLEDTAESLPLQVDHSFLAVRIKALKKISDEFDVTQRQLLALEPESFKSHSQYGLKFDQTVIDIETILRSRLASLQSSESIKEEDNANYMFELIQNQTKLMEKLSIDSKPSFTNQGRLPTIELKKFDGTTKEYVGNVSMRLFILII